MNLWPIAWKTSLAGGLVGTCIWVCSLCLMEQPSALATEPLGALFGLGIANFWILLWMVTPKKWWDFRN